MQIGLLEDDVAIQEMLRLVLEDENYTVVIYPTAEACLEALLTDERKQGSVPIDLLIVDLRLPRAISGMEIIRKLRNDPSYSSLPIILTTATSFVDIGDLTVLHVHFLEKPFDIDKLINMISELIANSSENHSINALG
jgi:two-component system, chemotaxis family, chemotaxis protein CheY